MRLIFTLVLLGVAFTGFTQEQQQQQPSEEASTGLFDMSLEDILNLELVDRNFYLYGYINSNIQKTFSYPSLSGGETVRSNDPLEWAPVQHFHLYGQGNLSNHISFLFNLAYSNDAIEVRNAWGNFEVIKDALQVRVGKMYRKFGLYNERLDQIPTFMGIEPPEMFDTDHLFLERTTNFMIHGNWRDISYAVMTDNGENGPAKDLTPVGWDLRYKSMKNSLIIGTSGYTSSINGNKTTSTVELGEGPPQGGILPWMAGDHFSIYGFFIEKQVGKILLQAEYYNASHNAMRDPEKVLSVINNASINDNQRERFLGNNTGKEDASLTTADVVQRTSFSVQTWYVRLGYDIQTHIGQFVPYVFIDWMSHPEDIRNKTYGGDNEAGLADDGKFFKPSAGVVYRPIPTVAVKLDGSYHTQKFNGETETYPEIRVDFSFAFSNLSVTKALESTK